MGLSLFLILYPRQESFAMAFLYFTGMGCLKLHLLQYQQVYIVMDYVEYNICLYSITWSVVSRQKKGVSTYMYPMAICSDLLLASLLVL